MSTHNGIADQARSIAETGLGKALEIIMTARSPKGASRLATLAPVCIGSAGLAVGVASLVLTSLRHRKSLGDPDARLRDVMIADVHTIEPGATVVEAAEQMRQNNVGALPIVEAGQIVGVITDRDLVVRVLAKRGVDPSTIRVMDCATRNPVVAREDWRPERALLVMAEHQIGRLPVVDGQGHLAGMVTLSSLARRSRKPDETLAAARKVSLRSARDAA
jgi:CBS domain-containing protein